MRLIAQVVKELLSNLRNPQTLISFIVPRPPALPGVAMTTCAPLRMACN